MVFRRLLRRAVSDHVEDPVRPLSVLHVLHTCDVGGVQTIAAELRTTTPSDVDYKTAVFAQPENGEVRVFEPDLVGSGLNRPDGFVRLFVRIRRHRPDVLVCSLWRSVLLGVAAKLLLRQQSFVVFLHNSTYTQPLDRLAHRVGLHLADAVYSDSAATARALLSTPRPGGVVAVPVPATDHRACPRELRLVYWGRLAAQKRIDRALHLLARLRLSEPGATLTLIGPDDGTEAELRALADELGLGSAVSWHPAVPREQLWRLVHDAAFFVQLSDFEGRALSVIEAMRWGIVPVVTPVGEIPAFTEHRVDTVVVDDLDSAADDVSRIWRSNTTWQQMASRAVKRWSEPEPGATDFFQLCRAVSTGT